MATGDAATVMLGTATTHRQPSSGVEERLFSAIGSGNDDACMYNGSDELCYRAIYQESPYSLNRSIIHNNTTYVRKEGTTDVIVFSLVQTNA